MTFSFWPKLLQRRRDPFPPGSHPLAHVALAQPFDALMPSAPSVAPLPAVMSENEQRFLHALARSYYTGEGWIVDDGIFLGASTLAFGSGLRGNPHFAEIAARRPRPIVAIERATVTPAMLRHFKRHGIGEGLEPGMSYARLLQQCIAPVQDLVELRIGDIRKVGVLDGPIEILFLDVLKNESIGLFAVENYFPKLIPGRSIVIQQDYLFDSLEFIKVHQEFFAYHFELVGEIASSAVFRCRAPIGAADLKRFSEARGNPDTQIALATAAIIRTGDPARQVLMTVSRLKLVLQLRGIAAARGCLAELERNFADVLRAPNCPPRVLNSVRAARFLCESSGDRLALKQAQNIAFGLVQPDGR